MTDTREGSSVKQSFTKLSLSTTQSSRESMRPTQKELTGQRRALSDLVERDGESGTGND